MGQIAQLVEHRTENPGVDGSIPSLPTTFNPSKTSRFYYPSVSYKHSNTKKQRFSYCKFFTKTQIYGIVLPYINTMEIVATFLEKQRILKIPFKPFHSQKVIVL